MAQYRGKSLKLSAVMSCTPDRCCRDSLTRRDIPRASGSGALLAAAGSFLGTLLVASEGNAPSVVATARTLLQPVSISDIRLLPGNVFHDRLELHRRGYLAHCSRRRLNLESLKDD